MEKNLSIDQGDVPRDDQTRDDITSGDEPSLSDYDKTVADSFPSSDPPALP